MDQDEAPKDLATSYGLLRTIRNPGVRQSLRMESEKIFVLSHDHAL